MESLALTTYLPLFNVHPIVPFVLPPTLVIAAYVIFTLIEADERPRWFVQFILLDFNKPAVWSNILAKVLVAIALSLFLAATTVM